jgi:DNA processing protein
MDRRKEQAALLVLLRDRKSGWSRVAQEVEETGSALRVLDLAANASGQADLFAVDAADAIEVRLKQASHDIAQWADEGMHLVTLLDDDYPPQLLTIHQRPPFLLYRGRLDPRDTTGVAIVGTRRPSDRGRATARTIAHDLAERGVTVVSGLAAGIDTAAHMGALDAGGRTVAVIGTGLRRSYPNENTSLQERIATSHLVLSQFWPDAAPTKTSFPMRNAVMSGYAAATVVIEAAWKSGARMQARLALEHGRPVFLHESLLQHDWARDYVARGAVIVRSSEDVLSALDVRLSPQVELVWS